MARLPIFKFDEIFTPPVKLLIKESHAIFSSIKRENSHEMTKAEIVALSRRYRSIVHECVGNLSRDLLNDRTEQIKAFRELEVIWSLCEILLIDVNQTGALVIQLKNWIKMHFEELSRDFKDILKALENDSYKFTENDVADVYWNLVVKLVLRGETKKAAQLLRSHYQFENNNQIQLVATMLERMPYSNQYIVHEFCNKWTTWSEWCKSERETGQFDNNKALLNVTRLLSQDTEVYKELAQECDSWYQLMVAYALYTDPCLKSTDLSELSRRCISIHRKNHPNCKKSSSEPDNFDEILVSAFEYDLMQVIAHSCSYLDDNWWFVTHFIDLLHCSNQLRLHEIVESDKLRETFIQDYASTLFDDEQLWSIGVAYLDSCSSSGTYFLEALLSRIPISIDDEAKALKLVALAKKRGLTSLSQSICSLMARGWLAKIIRLTDECVKKDKYKRPHDDKLPPAVNLSNALYWAIKGGDVQLTTYISDQHLYYYCKTHSFPDNSIFECLKRSRLENERLAFLAKYYEFKQLTQDSDNEKLDEAGSLIQALLASKIYPQFVSEELMEDAKSLLDVRPQLIFQPDKTLDLMQSIEEVTKISSIENDIELRKSLIRNMARSLITPAKVEK